MFFISVLQVENYLVVKVLNSNMKGYRNKTLLHLYLVTSSCFCECYLLEDFSFVFQLL